MKCKPWSSSNEMMVEINELECKLEQITAIARELADVILYLTDFTPVDHKYVLNKLKYALSLINEQKEEE